VVCVRRHLTSLLSLCVMASAGLPVPLRARAAVVPVAAQLDAAGQHTTAQASLKQATPEQALVARLEQVLNAPNQKGLEALLAPEQRQELGPRLRRFAQRFINARWRLNAGAPLADGSLPVAVSVSGSTLSNGLQYSMQASQQLRLRVSDGLISGQELVQDQSVLTSAREPLPVTLVIPDAVLTGSRYDVDVVLDEPLGQALVAGGLAALTARQVREQQSPTIQLEPMGGGGLFKSVQAPFQPGVQTWAAMLVHPDGVITVTKRVRVVNDRSEL
jgi:hypothetical protein